MLEEKNGRKIESIKFNKNSVSIYFENGESLKISEATFTHFYLYKDKVLSDEEYKSIEDHQALNSSKQYAINLLSKGMYTEKEILNRLINKKKLTSSDAKKIIDYLYDTYKDDIFISLMSQYTPTDNVCKVKRLNRNLSPKHYETMIEYIEYKGIKNVYIQGTESATKEYIPEFFYED